MAGASDGTAAGAGAGAVTAAAAAPALTEEERFNKAQEKFAAKVRGRHTPCSSNLSHHLLTVLTAVRPPSALCTQDKSGVSTNPAGKSKKVSTFAALGSDSDDE